MHVRGIKEDDLRECCVVLCSLYMRSLFEYFSVLSERGMRETALHVGSHFSFSLYILLLIAS